MSEHHSTFHLAGTVQVEDSQNINLSKNLKEIQSNGLDCKASQSNGLDCKASGTLSSNSNNQEVICNKNINGIQNGLVNGKAFTKRCNINGDDRKLEVCNGSSTMKLDESLRKLKVESQKKEFENKF